MQGLQVDLHRLRFVDRAALRPQLHHCQAGGGGEVADVVPPLNAAPAVSSSPRPRAWRYTACRPVSSSGQAASCTTVLATLAYFSGSNCVPWRRDLLMEPGR